MVLTFTFTHRCAKRRATDELDKLEKPNGKLKCQQDFVDIPVP